MKKSLPLVPFLLAAALALLAASCGRQENKKPADVAYYTCTMHPSVRSQDPDGKCPICGMSLVPVLIQRNPPAGLSNGPTEFTVPTERQQLIGVTYATVEMRPFQFSVRAAGVVTYDTRRRWSYVSRVDGYVHQLDVSSAGQPVEKGQPLLTLHSPDLLAAQREFVDLLRNLDQAKASGLSANLDSTQRNLQAARQRLSFWNIADPEIDELEKTRQPGEFLTLRSPGKGIVENLQAAQGQRVAMGDPLVSVVDLSAVWVWVDFYQDDLPWLTNGLPVTITVENDPGAPLEGTIALIDPFLNEARRTCRARVDLSNPDLKLRPQMFVTAEARVNLGPALAVPVSAVLPTGDRNLVFVDKGGGRLEPRLVELGRQAGEFYAVRKGLAAGERVVSSANFLMDAEAKVQGAIPSW